MSWIAAVVLLAGFSGTDHFNGSEEAVRQLAPRMVTGTLILSRGDCLAVRVYTKSRYTHVAAVVVRKGAPLVYDSMNGAGVRCLSLQDYLNSQKPTEIHLFQPREPFSNEQRAAFENYLESQLGRHYAVSHHLTGDRATGIHCSEYVTDALIVCELVQAKQPARVSPASLVEGITTGNLYSAGETFRLRDDPQPLTADASWCSRSWTCTRQCTSNCYVQLRRWFCCK